MDVDDYFGFENMTTPVPCSPVPHFSIANTKDTPSGEVTGPKGSPAVTQMTKTIFETPVEKPVKRFKRKRVSRVRQVSVSISSEFCDSAGFRNSVGSENRGGTRNFPMQRSMSQTEGAKPAGSGPCHLYNFLI